MRIFQKIDVRLHILILIGIISFLISINVFALTNYDTSYNLDIKDFDSYYSDISCGKESIKDFLHNFVNNYNDTNSLYNIIIFPEFDLSLGEFNRYNINRITFALYKKSNTKYNRFSFYGIRGGALGITYLWNVNATDTSYSYVVNLDTCDTSISSSTSYNNFLSYLYGNINITSSNYSSYSDVNGKFTKTRVLDSGDILYFRKSSYLPSVSNSTSYDVSDSLWYYWSNRILNYKAAYNNDLNSNDNYFKNLHFNKNNTTYTYLDDLPSYYDLYSNNSEPIEFGSMNKLNTIYTNFPSDEYQNFNLTIELDKNNTSINGYEYANNYIDNVICRGRVNHNDNYYTYEYLSCSYEWNVSYTNNHVVIEYNNLQFFNNGVEITDLSRYDKLFLTLSNNLNDSNIDMSANNVFIDFPIGNVIMNDWLGSIYDNFDNLPLLFKFYLSSNQSSLFDVYSRYTLPPLFSSGYVFWSQYNTNSLTPTTLVGNITTNFTKVSVSNSISSGIMIYQNDPNVLIPKIEFIFDKDLVISYSDTSSNSFYYIDSTDTIQNNNIQVNYDNVPSNNYDISFYVDKVNSFINNLSEDSAEIGSLTQELYDGLPSIFSTFIFVIFILFNIYFVYLMIRK